MGKDSLMPSLEDSFFFKFYNIQITGKCSQYTKRKQCDKSIN